MFDPNWPQSGDTLTGVLLRGQWNGLHDELEQQIAGIPAGPAGKDGKDGRDGRDGVDGAPGEKGEKGDAGEAGPAGPAGPPGADSTVPGPAGAEGRGIAAVNDYGDGRVVVVLTDGSNSGPFTVASGPVGPQGERGSDGSPGPAGADGMAGPQGPAGNDGVSVVNIYDYGDGRCMVQLSNGQTFGPFTAASGPAGSQGPTGADGRSLTPRGDWNSWTNYNPGDFVFYNGNIYVAFDYASGTTPDADGRWRVMTIVGPAGGPGPQGEPGSPGSPGPEGPQGPPGEITNQQLSNAIAGTSANSNMVQLLDPSADQAAILAKLNELISALRR